jgi:hypothetical protein
MAYIGPHFASYIEFATRETDRRLESGASTLRLILVTNKMDKCAAYVPDSTTTSASPFVTLSPGALSQETIFPSVIVDDRAGMNTSFTAGTATFLLLTLLRAAMPAGRVIFNESFILNQSIDESNKKVIIAIRSSTQCEGGTGTMTNAQCYTSVDVLKKLQTSSAFSFIRDGLLPLLSFAWLAIPWLSLSPRFRFSSAACLHMCRIEI